MSKEDESVEIKTLSSTTHIKVELTLPDETSVNVNTVSLAPPTGPGATNQKDIIAELREAAAQIPDELKHGSSSASRDDFVITPAEKKKAPLAIVIIVAILLAIAGGAIFFILNNRQNDDGLVANKPETNNPLENTDGVWQSKAMNGSCYMFISEEFYWRGNCTVENDNYLYGTREVIRGDDALNELNMSYDAAIRSLGLNDGVANDDIYAVLLHPTQQISFGQPRDVLPETIKMLFVVTGSEEAYGYRQDTGDTYVFFKRDDIEAPKEAPILDVGE